MEKVSLIFKKKKKNRPPYTHNENTISISFYLYHFINLFYVFFEILLHYSLFLFVPISFFFLFAPFSTFYLFQSYYHSVFRLRVFFFISFPYFLFFYFELSISYFDVVNPQLSRETSNCFFLSNILLFISRGRPTKLKIGTALHFFP